MQHVLGSTHRPLVTRVCALVTVWLSLGVAGTARAELIEKAGRFGGLPLTYKVLVPPGYDAAKAYPMVLVFTGGGQQLRGAENTINTDWRPEAERRGYIVVSPGTPDGTLFFEAADRVFPEFLDALLRDYKVRGGKLHVAGHSNGGLSAFHVAAKYPQYFATVTGYPGLFQSEADPSRIGVLKPMCLFMHVGDQDPSWAGAMKQQFERLQREGYKIRYAVEKNQVHRLKAGEINLSARLFNQIESCK